MRRTTIALLAIPALALTLACGMGDTADDVKGPGAQNNGSAGANGHTIIFEVTGPASADITYGTGADQSQANGSSLPWTQTVTASEVPFVMSLVAQSKGSGAINCKITVDGKVKKENTSTGQYAVVTCSA